MTVIIREMIEEISKLGRKPVEIKLTEEHYKKLFNELKKDTDLYAPAGYEIVPTGIVYHPKPRPKQIKEFMGLPVVIKEQTIVVWL